MPSDVTVDLIGALVENLRGAHDGWESLSMVLDFAGGKFSGTHGYAYSADGTVSAVASHPYHAKSAVAAYTDSYYGPEGKLPAAILVQFDRTSGKYEVIFEDEDASRWKVTPANIDAIREELRPQFA